MCYIDDLPPDPVDKASMWPSLMLFFALLGLCGLGAWLNETGRWKLASNPSQDAATVTTMPAPTNGTTLRLPNTDAAEGAVLMWVNSRNKAKVRNLGGVWCWQVGGESGSLWMCDTKWGGR
jgi:hypothetical protein